MNPWSVPIYYLMMLVFVFFLLLIFGLSGYFQQQLWIDTALRASTTAGVTQTANSPDGNGPVVNTASAISLAQKVWAQNSQNWTGSGPAPTATFTGVAVKLDTPTGSADSLRGIAQVQSPLSGISAFLQHLGVKSTVNQAVSDTVTSTIP